MKPTNAQKRNEAIPEKLGEAFFRLLTEDPTEKITVTRLCALAGISRKSFHRHFASLEDLARYELARQKKPNLPGEEATAEKIETDQKQTNDLLNNLPIGVCILYMPDETHQEVRFANKEQMRLINPHTLAPEKVNPQQSQVRRAYYINAFDQGQRSIHREFLSHPLGNKRLWVEGTTTLSKRPGSNDVIAFLAIGSVEEKKLTESIVDKYVREQSDYLCCIDAPNDQVVLFSSSHPSGEAERIQVGCGYEREAKEALFRGILPSEQAKLREFITLKNIVESLANKTSESSLFHSEEAGKSRIKMVSFSYLDRTEGLIALIQSDITEAEEQQWEQEKRLREALESAEKANSEKSFFLSSMSHDLRTPLNGVLGFAAYALKENDPAKKQNYLEKVISSGELLLNLINDTLDLSRIESGKAIAEPEGVMAEELVPAVVTALLPSAELKGIHLILDLSDYQNEPVWADKLKINKIILNLVSNSIKFTHAGGMVKVRPHSTISKDGGFGFEVEDTGIGMSEEFLKHMYEPFSQEKRSESAQMPGTGLGLSIVKRYVDLLGGSISATSQVHVGTKWRIRLPVSHLEGGLKEGPNPLKANSFHGQRILLCEDNPMNIEIATMLLQDAGLHVEGAVNGALGLEKFSASSPHHFDLILMDIRMPEMEGYEATKAIRALSREDAKSIPIIAMTADAFEESLRSAKEAGMDGYLTKPIEPRKLFAELQKHLSH